MMKRSDGRAGALLSGRLGTDKKADIKRQQYTFRPIHSRLECIRRKEKVSED